MSLFYCSCIVLFCDEIALDLIGVFNETSGGVEVSVEEESEVDVFCGCSGFCYRVARLIRFRLFCVVFFLLYTHSFARKSSKQLVCSEFRVVFNFDIVVG